MMIEFVKAWLFMSIGGLLGVLTVKFNRKLSERK